MIEIDDLKSKQSASLEINEALLRSEINNLKLDLESKSEYLNKYSENINTWKKDDKTINNILLSMINIYKEKICHPDLLIK